MAKADNTIGTKANMEVLSYGGPCMCGSNDDDIRNWGLGKSVTIPYQNYARVILGLFRQLKFQTCEAPFFFFFGGGGVLLWHITCCTDTVGLTKLLFFFSNFKHREFILVEICYQLVMEYNGLYVFSLNFSMLHWQLLSLFSKFKLEVHSGNF
jgi:hypothetical protein